MENMPEVTWCENYDLTNIVTPLDIVNYKNLLVESGYNLEKTQFLVNGFTNSFAIGFQGNSKDMPIILKLEWGHILTFGRR